ncbi:hypothetical protein OROGR_020109 [Orobanche gracilis]
MGWIHTKRRGPEWKQSWTNQTLSSSMSAPPLPLIAVFAIVVFLLSLSQYNTYKEQMRYTLVSFKIFLFLVPVLLIIFIRSSLLSSRGWWLNWWPSQPHVRRELAPGVAGFPWGVAVLVVVLLVLVFYHPSFRSKWFPFGSYT